MTASTNIYFDQTVAGTENAAVNATAGPLANMPIAIKANIAVRGCVASASSAALADGEPAESDAPVVAALRRAGLRIVATTVMDELAYGFTGRNQLFGYVANPHDESRVSGGSSSGAAAAVAAGLLDLAIGTDTNGSVRIPAALCGVWGLRPSAGSVSSEGVVPLSTTLDIPGPIASNARYLTALAEAIGIDTSISAAPEGLKIALVTGFPAAPATTEVSHAIEALAASLGVSRRAETPWATVARAGAQIVTAFEAAFEHRRLISERGHLLAPLLRDRLIAGCCVTREAYQQALNLRARLIGLIDTLFGEADVLLLPTVATQAPPADVETLEIDGAIEPINPAMGRCTIPFSFLGLPVLSAPIAKSSCAGLPIGAQLVGKPGKDAEVLALGRFLEERGLAIAHVVGTELAPANLMLRC